MNNGRTQDLTEAFASIIKLMLASIRAQGLRSLIHLPMLIKVGLELHRFGREFAAVMAALKAGTLPPPPPAPEPVPWTDPPDQDAAWADAPAPPRAAARPDPAARDRQRPAKRPSPPAAAAEPDRPRAAPAAAALPHARGQAVLPPPRRAPETRITVPGLPAGIIATGRSP